MKFVSRSSTLPRSANVSSDLIFNSCGGWPPILHLPYPSLHKPSDSGMHRALWGNLSINLPRQCPLRSSLKGRTLMVWPQNPFRDTMERFDQIPVPAVVPSCDSVDMVLWMCKSVNNYPSGQGHYLPHYDHCFGRHESGQFVYPSYTIFSKCQAQRESL